MTTQAGRLPGADFLDNVVQVLAQTEEQVARTEQGLETLLCSPGPDREETRIQILEQFEEHYHRLETGVVEAEQVVAQTETALNLGELALAKWRAQAEAVRAKLARWETSQGAGGATGAGTTSPGTRGP